MSTTASKQFQMKGLREKRGKIREELSRLGTKLTTEQRAMSPEEKTLFEKLKTDMSATSEAIKAAESDLSELDSLVNADMGDPAADPAAEPVANSAGRDNSNHRVGGNDGGDPMRRAADIKMARQAWARRQYGVELTPDHLAACKRVGLNPNSKELVLRLSDPKERAARLKQQRALTVTTSGGGYLIAEDYSFQLEQKLLAFDNVRGVCDEFQTETGADLPWPTEDDTSNTGELLAINTEVAYADPSFASITFGAYKFSSKGVIVPNELLQDAAFDVDALVFGEIGTRLGRIEGTYHTTGTGSSQPKGVVACASAGLTAASATAITADELTRLAHKVDPAYRSNPGCGYMMHDDVLLYTMMLKDANGLPIYRETWRDGSMDARIYNFPVYVNQKMTGFTSNALVTGTKHVLFGDYKKFKVRDAGPVRLKRLDERWAEKDQVGFVGFKRSDSNCVNTDAIKYLITA